MPSGGLYDELQRANKRSTRLLLAGGVVVVAVLVWVIFGIATGGAPLYDPILGLTVTAIGTGVGLFLTFIAYRSGPSIALRASKARPVSRQEAPELHNLLDEVCVSAGITGTKPKLYIVDDPAPNAFATGLKLEDSHIAVTTGLIERLPRYELRAVLAHEVAHILNDDIRAVTVAVATAGLVALLADVIVRMMWLGGARGGRRGGGGGSGGGGAQVIFLVLGLVALVLAPLAAQLIRFAVSRQREYLADATAAEVLRDPQSMVNALRRIDGDQTTLQHFEVATAHMWFEEPNDTQSRDASKGGNKAAKMARRFATHPSMKERIERLATLNAGTVRTDAPLPPPPSSRTDGRGSGSGSGTGTPPPPAPGSRQPGRPPPGRPSGPPGQGHPPSGPGGLPPFPGR
ncbi:MAG: zinc metalloprotease HtpX [Nitriliruptor sp.]|nr:MAG: zinc metalloprotease HtpX [Nitriliruptor sp.]